MRENSGIFILICKSVTFRKIAKLSWSNKVNINLVIFDLKQRKKLNLNVSTSNTFSLLKWLLSM